MKALNVCSNPRPSPTAPGRRPGKRWTLLLPLGWFVLLLALRAVNTAHYRINSDEPQHLHVMWALGEGRMPYRDVFDNHMPLFGALFAPVVHALGQTPDVVLLMRWALLPVPLIGLFFLFLLGRRVFGTVSALWAVSLSLAFSPWSLKAVEVRPDVLWATCWFAVLWLISLPKGKHGGKWVAAGFLLGCALAISVKTRF